MKKRIAVHEAEINWIDGSFPLPLEAVKAQLTKLPCAFPEDFDVDAYRLFQGTPQILLHDGDCFDLGGRTIRVLHTPGHAPGHHKLAIPVSLIDEINECFSQIEQNGQLKQGKGLFDFGDVKIHI